MREQVRRQQPRRREQIIQGHEAMEISTRRASSVSIISRSSRRRRSK
jgi:hypothetical protein